MEPTIQSVGREAWIGALAMSVVFIVLIPVTWGNFLLAQTVGQAAMFCLLAWRRTHSWWRALAAASLSVVVALPVSLLVRRLLE